MIKVIFKRSNGARVDIGVADNVESAWEVIRKFLVSKNYTSYYSRLWIEEDKIKIDVGSWTEFFYFEPLDMTVQELWEEIHKDYYTERR